ncbi:uncharacterized protein LOC141600052 [Silene latifolia]|uniref:uncharacterized protein LOC141600052 n=1 Tax=Silene latifolia TaxID=37657 RepID=UPI003D785F49
MVTCIASSKWFLIAITFIIATIPVLIAVCWLVGKKLREVKSKLRELETSLKGSISKYAAERQGRIRAQQALRKTLQQKTDNNLAPTSYPMVPIATVQSCFSSRNGTPRQPLLVPLARACLIFDPSRVPPASLEGLEEYSHIWIIYVFHLNTDLEKLWLEPSRSKVKAKVRVPRLKGGKKGVFATRSPHRPCPIGLTVAKIEAVQGHMILLSGVDLVDGTPVLDVKPYLPYCDSIKESAVPDWVKADSSLTVASVTFDEGFHHSLEKCWQLVEKSTLYASPSEMKGLIEQVLAWDIRSPVQRNRPHTSTTIEVGNCEGDESFDPTITIYHLVLESLDISYRIDSEGNVIVDSVAPGPSIEKSNRSRCNYTMWKDELYH